MSEWQPIETAPRDGAEIVIGEWVDGEWYQFLAFWNVFGQETEPYWAEAVNYDLASDTATHWMPLPPPPSP